MSVSEDVRRRVADRDGVLNPSGHDYHHCFFKSEFFDDIDGEWNGVACPRYIHDCIHHPSDDNTAKYGHKMEILYKIEALERYTGKHRDKLSAIVKRKKHRYGIF